MKPFEICPVTKNPCARTPACQQAENTGSTGCAEWVLKQQRQGEKELREKQGL